MAVSDPSPPPPPPTQNNDNDNNPLFWFSTAEEEEEENDEEESEDDEEEGDFHTGRLSFHINYPLEPSVRYIRQKHRHFLRIDTFLNSLEFMKRVVVVAN